MITVPSTLRATAEEEGPAFQAWLDALPGTVTLLAQRWDLRLGEPYEPGGSCSWVAPAGDGLVLKVGWNHVDAGREADALRLWDGDGAVRLHDAAQLDGSCALLLERCEPGTPLGTAVPEPEQDMILAGVLQRLWCTPPDGHPFRSLAAMCAEWATEFDEDPPIGLDPGLARAGRTLFIELPHPAADDVLLCTDLHGANILAAGREPWLAIDPKPHVGDRTFDALQHMINCPERLLADPIGLACRMAGLLDLDADRLRLWLFAKCVIESAWQPDLVQAAVVLRPS